MDLHHLATNVLEATRSSEKELGYESSEWHLEEADHGHTHAAPAANNAANQKKANQAAQPAAQASAQKAASPCAWLENLFVQKQAQTVDQSRSAQNAAAAIEQMVNTGAVSRGQFGQVVAPAVAEVTSTPSNNAYISQSPVKQEARENVEKDDKVQQQRPNNKNVSTKSNVNSISTTTIKNHSNNRFMKRLYSYRAKSNVN